MAGIKVLKHVMCIVIPHIKFELKRKGIVEMRAKFV